MGQGVLLGRGGHPKSRLVRKLEAGDRDIYEEYISFRCWNGKLVRSIERRCKMEFLLLYEYWVRQNGRVSLGLCHFVLLFIASIKFKKCKFWMVYYLFSNKKNSKYTRWRN